MKWNIVSNMFHQDNSSLIRIYGPILGQIGYNQVGFRRSGSDSFIRVEWIQYIEYR